MSKKPDDETPEAEASQNPEHSVIRFLERKTGEAPRVNLREEDSASVSAPGPTFARASRLACWKVIRRMKSPVPSAPCERAQP